MDVIVSIMWYFHLPFLPLASCRPVDNRFGCESGICLADTVRCNGVFECFGGSDELACETPPTVITCGSDQQTCLNKLGCYTKSEQCNRIWECSDGTDVSVSMVMYCVVLVQSVWVVVWSVTDVLIALMVLMKMIAGQFQSHSPPIRQQLLTIAQSVSSTT